MDFDLIESSRVAVYDWSALEDDDLAERTEFGLFRDNTDARKVYQMSIIDAFELRIVRDKQFKITELEDIEYTWELVSFDEDEIDIQIHFDNPEAISTETNKPDTVSITFWG
jgi:hypothetical protein